MEDADGNGAAGGRIDLDTTTRRSRVYQHHWSSRREVQVSEKTRRGRPILTLRSLANDAAMKAMMPTFKQHVETGSQDDAINGELTDVNHRYMNRSTTQVDMPLADMHPHSQIRAPAGIYSLHPPSFRNTS